MLEIDHNKRITAEQILEHPYLSAYHQPDDEPVHEKEFDFAFESVQSIDEMRGMIVSEVQEFKKGSQIIEISIFQFSSSYCQYQTHY